MRTTITVPEISERIGICEETIYSMLRSRVIPNIRYGRRFIISRNAFERWEATIGEQAQSSVSNTPIAFAARSAASPKARSAKAA